jgi:hypothetical protein
MTRTLSSERGNALITALLLTTIMLASVGALIGLVNGEQSDSRRERERESSFQLAEGVLNAQIYQLSTYWPGASSKPYPASCTSTTTHEFCPVGTTLQGNFSGVDYTRSKDWKVQVFDNQLPGSAAPTNYYTESLATGATPNQDANDDNFLWVRAQSTVAGRKRTLVALVEAENVTLNFPRAALVAGHFEVTNSGKKIIIDTNGESDQFTPGDIIVRCQLTDPNCAVWDAKKDQVSPATVRANPAQPPAVSPEALDQLRARAQAEGNYYEAGQCGALAGDEPGELVFLEDPSGCKYNANTVYNSADKPGYVVIGKGSGIDLNGTATFYGIIYHANTDNRTGSVLELSGNISVYGSIVIDGPGGLDAGSSKVNLVYDPNVFGNFKAFGTAGIVQNTFREITASN